MIPKPLRSSGLARNRWTREQEEAPCPACGAAADEQCVTRNGNGAPLPHMARFYAALERRNRGVADEGGNDGR